jgi:spoIIIJ-associated protein
MDEVYDVEVEAQAKTVEEAKELAIEKLGIPADRVEFTVVQEAKGGFMGFGGQPAVITARAKPPEKRKRRRRRRGGSGSEGAADRPARDKGQGGRGGKGGQGKSGGRSGDRPAKGSQTAREPAKQASSSGGRKERNEDTPTVSIEEQGRVASEFISGLLDAFGLEGEVVAEIDEDILILRVNGDQTEALVGPRGTIMQSVLELTRTVVQRKTFGAPRMRLDIAGYGERRREALKIYANKLAESVLADGGEIMLEPMNPADRKVVHDAIAEIDGVRSFSEGEDPERSVIVAPAE